MKVDLKMLSEKLMNEPTIFDKGMPIKPRTRTTPIVPQEKWQTVTSRSSGTKFKARNFTFSNLNERNVFINEILSFETSTGHLGEIKINDLSVFIKVTTLNVGQPTEMDEEYANYADEIYEDILFSNVGGT